MLGGTVGLSTATRRHSSSSILQRLGARRAQLHGEELPAYYDPLFDCEMELLEFDSQRPAARYAEHIHHFRSEITQKVRVICHPKAAPTSADSLGGLLRALRASTHSEFPLDAFAQKA